MAINPAKSLQVDFTQVERGVKTEDEALIDTKTDALCEALFCDPVDVQVLKQEDKDTIYGIENMSGLLMYYVKGLTTMDFIDQRCIFEVLPGSLMYYLVFSGEENFIYGNLAAEDRLFNMPDKIFEDILPSAWVREIRAMRFGAVSAEDFNGNAKQFLEEREMLIRTLRYYILHTEMNKLLVAQASHRKEKRLTVECNDEYFYIYRLF